jgi:PAS domain S-box-containing protein
MDVLYVEDTPQDADLAKRFLLEHAPHIHLDIVEMQPEAEMRLDGKSYDLVLADLKLPKGDGLSLLAYIRAKGIPVAVVIITGSGDEESVITSLRAGADDYVIKSEGYLENLPQTLEVALQRYQNKAARKSKPIRVLYGEHNQADVDLTQRHLNKMAPHIVLDVVRIGPAILKRLSGPDPELYDVLLLDYRLSGINALEVLKELRLMKLDFPVVLTTGHGDEEVALQALKMGAYDYVVKSEGYLHRLPTILENAFYQARLSEEEARYRGLYETVPVGLYQTSLEGQCISANPALVTMLGYPNLETLKTSNVNDHYLDITQRQALFDELERNDMVSGFEVQLERYDQVPVWVELDARALRNLGGEIICLQGAMKDITARKKAEEALQENEERFRLAMQATAEGLWDWDVSSGQIYFNPGFYRLIGFDSSEFDASVKAWQELIHPEEQPRALEVNKHCIENHIQNFEIEYRLGTKAGEWKWVLASGMAVTRDEQGKALRIVGTIQDLDERKKIEQMMVENEKLAGIGTLSAGIAHEINTPLQVITGLSDSLKRRQLGEDPPESTELVEKLETISRNAWRIAGIVRSLLDYAHSSTSQAARAQINDIVKQTLLLLEHQFATWANITITKYLAEGIPDIVCDPNKITQVLINLLTNARDAMPDGGGIEIRSRYDSKNQNVIVSISDTGEGISIAIQTKVFDPFFTTKPVGSGTGLGLSISQSILRAHNGSLGLESSSKEGSVFSITLPLYKPE